MSSISVHLEVPAFIESGLASGSMERVGGVIRFAGNKRIVAWLREGGEITEEIASGSGLLHSILKSTGKSAAAIGNILGRTLPVLSIAFAGYELSKMIGGIEDNQKEIEAIYERVEEQFRRDRLTELFTALEIGKRVLKVRDPDVKAQQVGEVNVLLVKSKEHVVQYFNDLLTGELQSEVAEQALRYAILAMQITTLQARCWLEIGEIDSALEWLCFGWEETGNLTRRFAHNRLGDRRAYFFHISVSKESFDRFLNVEQWLRGKRNVYREIVIESQEDFWEDSMLDPISFRRFPGTARILHDPPPYESSLRQVEVLIENYQRLEGFKQELQSTRQGFIEWDRFDGDGRTKISEYNGHVLLIDSSETDQ